MATINQLSAVTTLTTGDNLVLWIPNQGDTRRASLMTLIEFLSEGVFTSLEVRDYIKTDPVTVANLPSASDAGAGARAFVSDATATTFASTVAGGGANLVPVYSNGTDWKIG